MPFSYCARQFFASMLFVTLSGMAVQSHATNGYFTHGVGTKNKSLAGAGSAMPQEIIAGAINPASIVVVNQGVEVGLGLFSPRRSYSTTDSLFNGQFGTFTIGPDSVDSDREYFAVPYVAAAWRLGDSSALATSFYGRGGMNTTYDSGTATFDPDSPAGPAPVSTQPGTFGSGQAGVDLSQAFIDLTYAWQAGPVNLGISAVLAAQAFEIYGFSSLAGYTKTFAASGGTVFPQNLSDNGHELSFGYGFKLGAIWDVNHALKLAASYQHKTEMQKFDDYADLFAQGGGFDIPANARVGVSWLVSNALSLHLDVEKTWFSSVDSVGNSINNILACPTAGFGGTDVEACLGGDNGVGFGWDDMTTYKIGAQWQLSALPDWVWRAGYSQGDQPIPENQVLVNILAPGVVEQHFTFGASRSLKGGREISFALMYAPEESVRGNNTFDPTQSIELKMHQYELEFAIRF